mmetsp:Transcript_25322/g.74776  ORF Transcript_25322/g.74776 Transcript_25322/m.74776 type:complete len:1149 (-) Transcript_25322:721-4167(-)
MREWARRSRVAPDLPLRQAPPSAVPLPAAATSAMPPTCMLDARPPSPMHLQRQLHHQHQRRPSCSRAGTLQGRATDATAAKSDGGWRGGGWRMRALPPLLPLLLPPLRPPLLAVLLPALLLMSLSASPTDALDFCTPTPRAPAPVPTTYNASVVLASGALPAPGGCVSHALTVNVSDSACEDTSSLLLFELWLQESDGDVYVDVDVRQTADGVVLAAARGGTAPAVARSSGGSLLFQPELALGPDPTLSAAYTDVLGIANGHAWQRFNVSIGALLDSGFAVDAAAWHVTVANVNPDLPEGSYKYELRATCMLAASAPCARPTARSAPCGGNGVCVRPDPAEQPRVAACACSDAAWAGDTCGAAVENLNVLGTTTPAARRQLQAPGSTIAAAVGRNVPAASWRYFSITVPAADSVVLRTELRRPASSVAAYRAAIQVQRGTLPSRNNFPSRVWDLNSACTCTRCECYMPYQARPLSYDIKVLSGENAPVTYFVGVYNALAFQVPIEQLLQLSVTASVDAGPLCPDDCSGQGACINYASGGATFACGCRPGYGGEFCQGVATRDTVTFDAGSYASGLVTLQPAEWRYHYFTTDVQGTLTLQWDEAVAASPLLLAFGPMYATSFGERFFQPSTTWVFNRSAAVQLPGSSSADGGPVGWMVGVLNSATEASVPSTYQLWVELPKDSKLSFLSTIQMALIGAISGLIIALIVFMGFRLLMLRRAMGRLTPEEIAALGLDEGGHPVRRADPGVPPHIVHTFPTFVFDPDTFAEHAKKKKEGNTADDTPASPGIGAFHGGKDSGEGGGRPDRSITSDGGSPSNERDDPADGTETSGAADTAAAAAADMAAAPDTAAAAAGVAAAGENELPQCPVCLCEYEGDEVLRQLPCGHIFHRSCIDEWMKLHNTCPNCRMSLVPLPTQEEREEARAAAAAARRPRWNHFMFSNQVSPRPTLQPPGYQGMPQDYQRMPPGYQNTSPGYPSGPAGYGSESGGYSGDPVPGPLPNPWQRGAPQGYPGGIFEPAPPLREGGQRDPPLVGVQQGGMPSGAPPPGSSREQQAQWQNVSVRRSPAMLELSELGPGPSNSGTPEAAAAEAATAGRSARGRAQLVAAGSTGAMPGQVLGTDDSVALSGASSGAASPRGPSAAISAAATRR